MNYNYFNFNQLGSSTHQPQQPSNSTNNALYTLINTPGNSYATGNQFIAIPLERNFNNTPNGPVYTITAPIEPTTAANDLPEANTNTGSVLTLAEALAIESVANNHIENVQIPAGANWETITNILHENGIKESMEELMGMDSKIFVRYKKACGYSKAQKKLIENVRKLALRRAREKRRHHTNKIPEVEASYIPLNSTPDQIQEILTKAGIDESMDALMTLNSEDFHKFRTNAERFNKEQQKLLSIARKRMKRRHKYIEQRLKESLEQQEEDFPRGVLRTPAQMQEILTKHEIPVLVENLVKMNSTQLQDLLATYTDDQKNVIRNCRHRLASLLCSNSIFAADLKEKVGDWISIKESFAAAHETHNFVDTYQISLPTNISEEAMQELLFEAGVQETLDEVMAMDNLSFLQYKEKLTPEQLSIARAIRDRLRKRHKSLENRLAKARSTTEEFPKGIYRTPEQLQQSLDKHEIKVTLKQLLTMETPDYEKWKKDNSFTPEQLDVIYKTKNRLMNMHHASSTMLIEYLSKQDDLAFEKLLGDDEDPSNESPKKSFYIPNKPTEKQAQEILEKACIRETIEEIMAFSSRDFSEYRKTSEYTEDQKNLLTKIRYKMKSKNLNDESEKLNIIAPLEPIPIVKKIRKYKPGEFKGGRKRKLKPWELVLERSKETQTDFAEHRPSSSSSSAPGPSTASQLMVVSIGGKTPDALAPKPTPPEPQGEKVNIHINYQGHKIFTKESKIYPGHVYTFFFKSIMADEKHSDGIEFYECANCSQSVATLRAQRPSYESNKTVMVSKGKIVFGSYDGKGHICVPVELMQRKNHGIFRT